MMKKSLIVFSLLFMFGLMNFVSAAETTIRVLDCFTKEPVVNQEIEFVPVTVISDNTFEYHYEKRE